MTGNKNQSQNNMNSSEILLEKSTSAMMPAGRAHVPDRKFIEEQFPEPVMPAVITLIDATGKTRGDVTVAPQRSLIQIARLIKKQPQIQAVR